MTQGDETSGGWSAPSGPTPPPPPPPPPPSPLEPVRDEVHEVRRGSGRARLAIVALVTAGLLGGGLALIASRGDDVDPAEALTAAQDVVERSTSFRFEHLQVSRVQEGDPDGSGTDTTTRTLLTGVVAAADRWKVTEDLGTTYSDEPEVYEAIRVGDRFYTDSGSAMTGDVEGPAWIEMPADAAEMTVDDIVAMYEELDESGPDGFDDAYRLDLVLTAYTLGMSGEPSEITRLVAEAEDPSVEDRLPDGGVLLRTRLAPVAALAEASEEPIPPVDLMLELDDDDRPVVARFTAESGSASADVTVSFSDWGADLVVEAPPADNIDRTPWIQEEALATTDPTLVVAPATLPPGLALSGISVVADDPEWDTCAGVQLTYSSEEERVLFSEEGEPSTDQLDALYSDLDYLNVGTSSLSCALEVDETPFDGELAGLPARGDGGWWEVQVGDTVVAIDTSFGDDVVLAVAASLRPYTPTELADTIPDWVEELGRSGAFFG